MYTLGNYNRALVRVESDDGEKAAVLELERSRSLRLCINDGRDGPAIFGVSLEDDGRFRVITWDTNGEICGELYCGVQSSAAPLPPPPVPR